MCAFILCLFFLFFLDNKKTFKHEWVYMSFCTSGCGAFEDFYLSFRLFLSVSIFSLYIPDSTPCLLCVCVSGWFTLAFSCSSLFGGDCAQAVDWGLSLAFVCSVRHLSPPPRALLCAPLTGSVWGLTGTSVPRLHISLSCLFWTTPSLSTSED